ncbi:MULTISPECIES: hypothetical protein [unclassified Streptomyces]|uniref:hypothetical protein n=1 Tax=unclassified Streptomyces TaxID=2593676 RepID=UPI003D91536C
MAEIVAVVEQRTGVRLPTGRPSVMDSTRQQLLAADVRGQHLRAALNIVLRRWFWPKSVATLGELVPDLPEDVRDQIADHLVRAGLS